MAVTRRVRFGCVAVGAVLLAGAATGITYAATSGTTPTTVRACANAKGSLALLSSKGTCPKGYSAVTINRQGRTGATGKTGAAGKTGATGRTGPRGPGAVSLVAGSATDAVHQQGREIGGTGVFVQVRCAPSAAELTIYDPTTDKTRFDVRGTTFRTGSGATIRNGLGDPADIASGTSLVSVAVTDPYHGLTVEDTSGSMTQQLIVTRLVGAGTAAHMTTFTVSVFSSYGRGCLMQAQATPSG